MTARAINPGQLIQGLGAPLATDTTLFGQQTMQTIAAEEGGYTCDSLGLNRPLTTADIFVGQDTDDLPAYLWMRPGSQVWTSVFAGSGETLTSSPATPTKKHSYGLSAKGMVDNLQRMGLKRILFHRENEAAAQEHTVLDLPPRFQPHDGYIREIFTLLSGLAGYRIDPDARLSFSTPLFIPGRVYAPLAVTGSGGCHRASIDIHPACLHEDPVAYLRRIGYSDRAIRHFLFFLPSDIFGALYAQLEGNGPGVRGVFESCVGHELTHAVHLLLEDRWGIPNWSIEAGMDFHFLHPGRTREVMAELAAYMANLFHEDPLKVASCRCGSSLILNPIKRRMTEQDIRHAYLAEPLLSDFDFGHLFSKTYLGVASSQYAHAIAYDLTKALSRRLYSWFVAGLIRNEEQIFAAIRLWFLYALYSYPRRYDVVSGSAEEMSMIALELKQLILAVAGALTGQRESRHVLSQWAIFNILSGDCGKQLEKDLQALLRDFERLAGEKEARELRMFLRHIREPGGARTLEAMQGSLNEESSVVAIRQICNELAGADSPQELARIVLSHIERMVDFLKEEGIERSMVFEEMGVLADSVRGEDFGSGRNGENPILRGMLADWETYKIEYDYYERFARDPEGYRQTTPWMRIFNAATILNGLPDEREVPKYPLVG